MSMDDNCDVWLMVNPVVNTGIRKKRERKKEPRTDGWWDGYDRWNRCGERGR
jgi:hypothetical protein